MYNNISKYLASVSRLLTFRVFPLSWNHLFLLSIYIQIYLLPYVNPDIYVTGRMLFFYSLSLSKYLYDQLQTSVYTYRGLSHVLILVCNYRVPLSSLVVRQYYDVFSQVVTIRVDFPTYQ